MLAGGGHRTKPGVRANSKKKLSAPFLKECFLSKSYHIYVSSHSEQIQVKEAKTIIKDEGFSRKKKKPNQYLFDF